MATASGNPAAKQTSLQHWLRINPRQKPQVYAQITATAEMSNIRYWLEILLSAGIAAFGLVLDSPAVIIGAMLISPLMGPIMATGLALAAGDLYLAVKAVANLVASISLAITFSAAIVWLLPFHSVTAEILARTNPTLLDLGVALFSGLAGSIAVSRVGGGDGVTTLPGVAIAVALMPPLCTIGFGLGSGANTRIMGGAGLLFLTNLVAIVASAFVVFLLTGMNAPEVKSEIEQSRKGETFARVLSRSPLSQVLINSGQLRWRILMLVVLLGAIAVPLRTAFLQVTGEAITRNAIQEVVKGILPPGALVSQQVEMGRQSVAVRLISTQEVTQEKLHQAELEIERRSGRKAILSVAGIASQTQLAQLTQRLSAPMQTAPKPVIESLADIDQRLTNRIRPVLAGVWPAEVPLQDFDIVFSSTSVALSVRYESNRELGKVALGLITRELQEKLGTPDLSVLAQRVPPAHKASRNGQQKLRK